MKRNKSLDFGADCGGMGVTDSWYELWLTGARKLDVLTVQLEKVSTASRFKRFVNEGSSTVATLDCFEEMGHALLNYQVCAIRLFIFFRLIIDRYPCSNTCLRLVSKSWT